jgi:hypothetical protein
MANLTSLAIAAAAGVIFTASALATATPAEARHGFHGRLGGFGGGIRHGGFRHHGLYRLWSYRAPAYRLRSYEFAYRAALRPVRVLPPNPCRRHCR